MALQPQSHFHLGTTYITGKIIVLCFNWDAVMPVKCILDCATAYIYEGFEGRRHRSLRDYELSNWLLCMNKQLLTAESVWLSVRK